MATSGTLRIEIIEARLTRDTETFSKMDPYCVIETRQQKHRTRTLQGAGKTPKWDQAFDVDVKYIGDDMTIKVLDEDISSSDTVRRYNSLYPSKIVLSNHASISITSTGWRKHYQALLFVCRYGH